MTPGASPIPRGGLSKARRIRSRSDYQRIQESRFRHQTRHFVFVLANRATDYASAPGARLGMIVSRKVGNAVVRNRVKRLVRDAFRTTSAMFCDGLDIVVIARSTEEGWKLADVVTEWLGAEERLTRLSKRLGLQTG